MESARAPERDEATPAQDYAARTPERSRGAPLHVRELQRAAGNAAVARLVVGTRPRAAEPLLQRYEAWEHRQLGDSYGGDKRSIRLPNGIELTYGQIVALSGDFYRSPEALLGAPASELQEILAVMSREQGQAAKHRDPKSPGKDSYAPSEDQVNANNADYEMATTGHDRRGTIEGPLAGDRDTIGGATGPHGEVVGGEHVESGAPGPQAGFLDLAGENAAHFSPENIKQNWEPKHRLALDLARRAWAARNPGRAPAGIDEGKVPSVAAGGVSVAEAATRPSLPPTNAGAVVAAPGRPDPASVPTAAGTADAGAAAGSSNQLEAQAWLTAAFSDHFLTDAFASGHLVSGSDGRTICRTYYDTHKNQIAQACMQCAIADGLDPQSAVDAVSVIGLALESRAPSLLLKIVHDFYNEHGISVRNALSQEWTTFGDAHLGGHPETIGMAELASKASRDAVQDVLATGGTARGSAALDYVPDMARLPGGSWKSIAAFSVDPAVWDPVLALSLSGSPVDNALYHMVKGNIGPQAGVMARKAGRWVEKKADAAVHAVASIPDDIEHWFGRIEDGIKRLYGSP